MQELVTVNTDLSMHGSTMKHKYTMWARRWACRSYSRWYILILLCLKSLSANVNWEQTVLKDEWAPVPKHQSHENVHSRENSTTLDVKRWLLALANLRGHNSAYADQKARWLPRDDRSGPRNRRQTKRVFWEWNAEVQSVFTLLWNELSSLEVPEFCQVSFTV